MRGVEVSGVGDQFEKRAQEALGGLKTNFEKDKKRAKGYGEKATQIDYEKLGYESIANGSGWPDCFMKKGDINLFEEVKLEPQTITDEQKNVLEALYNYKTGTICRWRQYSRDGKYKLYEFDGKNWNRIK